MVRLRGVVVVVVLVLVLVVEGVSVNQKTPPPYSSQADDAMKQLMKAGVYLPHIYLPWLVAPNSTCSQALEDMADNIDAKNSWAARMVDSWGKSYDGYYFGSGGLYGVYDECVSTTSTKGDFKGRFCSINMWKIIPEGEEGERSQCTPGQTVPKLTLNLPQQHKLKGLKNMDARNAPAITINYNANIEIFYTTCIPSVCTSDDLGVSLFFTMLSHGYYAYPEACYVEEPEVSYDAAVISFICVCSLVFTLLVVASLLDFYILYSGRTQLTKGHLKYLLVFSAYTNAGKIFKINNESPPSTISCLHGMRVLSMTWVIMCHQVNVTFFATANINGLLLNDAFSSLIFQVYGNGFLSVDTFFFMSGLLLSYSVLRELKRSRRFNFPIYILHRYIRLSPPILLVAGMYATVARFFLTGVRSDWWWYGWEPTCRKFWWKDALLINNISMDMCLGQTWYLSADTQMYIIAPLIILPLFFYKRAGKVWLFVMTAVSILIPTIIIMVNDLPPTSLIYDLKSSEYYDKVYFESWCRATPWMIGIWLGYIIVQQGNTRPKMNGLVVAVGWTLATLTGLLVVFGMWSYNIPYITDPSLYITWDTMTQLTYGGLHRPAWAAALAWVVYSCHYGYGGLVNGFLSHPSWQPLSRLTYCMYLVALQMQYLIAYTLRVPFYYTNLNKVIETVGAICVSFPVTVLASLMSEAPIIGLEKLLLGSARKPRPTEAQPTKPTTSDINNPNEAAGDLTEATNTNHHDTPAAGDLTEATNTSNHDTPAAGDLTEATNTSNHDTPAAGDLTEAEKSPLSYMMEDLESNQQQPANNGHDNPTLILEEGLIQRQMNETNNIHL